MANPLMPGQNVSLTRENPDLVTVVASFRWEVIRGRSPETEIVPSVILCGDDGKAVTPESLVFFNRPLSEDKHVEYVENGENEQIEVDIAFIPPHIKKLVFVVYINPEERRPGSFDMIRKAHIKLSRLDGTEIISFDIPKENLSHEISAMIFGEIYRHRDEWKFRALGQGYDSGLRGVATAFNVDV